MVSISKKQQAAVVRTQKSCFLVNLPIFIALKVTFFVIILQFSKKPLAENNNTTKLRSQRSTPLPAIDNVVDACPYISFDNLTINERYPKASSTRHSVDPPLDTNMTLVCCETTAGPWSIVVHHSWAPIGAQRFLDMVTSNYFSNKVPFMRCLKDFLCQFGLAGEPSSQFESTIPDDPQWLPPGPTARVNKLGVKRFQQGYFAYAGGGKDSRTQQLIVALKDNGPLGGGSPWEVPWGELVGT
jgi:cyclophilin family peptidyl-prolyl cis-trans isomerase